MNPTPMPSIISRQISDELRQTKVISWPAWMTGITAATAVEDPTACIAALLEGGSLLTLIDAADAPSLSAWAWWPLSRADGRGWYAVRWETSAGRRRSVYLHRCLLAAPPGADVVHVNGDGLDNRRANLRLCTRSQSAAKRLTCSPQTGYRGVYRDRRSYRAQITVGGKTRSLGHFASAEVAAIAYDQAAREAFGWFARLNFPEGQP